MFITAVAFFLYLGHSTLPTCGCSVIDGDSFLANSITFLSHEQER